MTRRASLALIAVAAAVVLLAGCGMVNSDYSPAATETPVDADPTPPVAVPDPPVWVATVPRLSIPGQRVTVTGQGFEADEPVDEYLLDASGQPVLGPIAAQADALGALASGVLDIPSQLPGGQYNFAATGQHSGRQARAILWLRSTSPSIEVNKTAVRPEESLTLAATGFAPGERVVVYFAGNSAEPLTALPADQNGAVYVANLTLPIAAPGKQELVATGGDSMAQARREITILPFDPVVLLNANNVPPGEAVGIFGYGFAARDQVTVALENSDELPLTLRTDDKGRLISPATFRIPTDAKGARAFVVKGQRTDRSLRVTFQVVPSYPSAELNSYFGQAGSAVNLSARYLRPRERLDVYAGEGSQRERIATFRADENGWLPRDAPFQIPQDARPGALTLSLEGEAARPALRLQFIVSP